MLLLASLLLAIDGTVLGLAVPAFTASSSPTAEQLLWIGDVYPLALAGLLVLMGNLYGRFGRKGVLLIGSRLLGCIGARGVFDDAEDADRRPTSPGRRLVVERRVDGRLGSTPNSTW
ncbi:MAG: hypothetical protein ABWY58_10270 [Aeromicrobium sp.]